MANNIKEKRTIIIMKGELPYQILEYRLELPMISKWFWHKHRNVDKWNRIENQE